MGRQRHRLRQFPTGKTDLIIIKEFRILECELSLRTTNSATVQNVYEITSVLVIVVSTLLLLGLFNRKLVCIHCFLLVHGRPAFEAILCDTARCWSPT